MTWRTPALAAGLALVLGAGLGWRLAPRPPPEVRLVARELTTEERESLTRTVTVAGPVREVAGPERVVERWRTLPPTPSAVPGCPPCPGCEEHVRVEEHGPVVTERGPVVTDTLAAASSTRQDARAVELAQTPAPAPPRPGWALSAGMQLLPDRRLALGLERRLVGPVWARVWVLQPAAVELPAVGVGARVEW